MESNLLLEEEMKDGGPAYPTDASEERNRGSTVYPGMSLRDYFAAAALQGVLSDMVDHMKVLERTGHSGDADKVLARFCYEYADAMLAERDK